MDSLIWQVNRSVRARQIVQSLFAAVILFSLATVTVLVGRAGVYAPGVSAAMMIASPIAAAALTIIIWRARCVHAVTFDSEFAILHGALFRRRAPLDQVQLVTIQRHEYEPSLMLLSIYPRRWPLKIWLDEVEAWECALALRELCPHVSGIGPDHEVYPPLNEADHGAAIAIVSNALLRRAIFLMVVGMTGCLYALMYVSQIAAGGLQMQYVNQVLSGGAGLATCWLGIRIWSRSVALRRARSFTLTDESADATPSDDTTSPQSELH